MQRDGCSLGCDGAVDSPGEYAKQKKNSKFLVANLGIQEILWKRMNEGERNRSRRKELGRVIER